MDIDIGWELFSGDDGGVDLEVGGGTDCRSISKGVKDKINMKVEDILGWYVDRDFDAEMDRKIYVEV